MKRVLIALFVLLSFNGYGQNVLDNIEVVFGPSFEVDKRSVPTEFVGSDETGFYMVYSMGKKGFGDNYLYKFGYDLKPLINKDLSVLTGGQKTEADNVFMLKGQLYQINRLIGPNSAMVYLHKIDHETLEAGAGRQIAGMSDTERSASRSNLSVKFSLDSSKIAVVYTLPNKRKDFESFEANVFDSDFNKLWSQTFELPYENRLLDIQDYTLSNDGKLFITARRFYNTRRMKSEGEANYDYLLLSFLESGKIDSLNIQSEGKYLRSMRVDVSENGDVVSAGFYSENSSNGLGGAFYLRINGENGEVVSSSFKRFDIDFHTENMTENKVKRVKKRADQGKNVELPNYFIDEFIAKPDGGVQMIGEKRLEITTYISSGLITVPTTTYYYDDIVVVDIDSEGQIKWAKRVAKKQQTTDDGAVYSSYSASITDNSLAFVFNDHADNLDYDGVGKVARMSKNKSTVVMAATVNSKGEIEKKGLFRRGEAEIKIRPALSQQLNDKEMLLFGHNTVRNQRFVIIKFEQ